MAGKRKRSGDNGSRKRRKVMGPKVMSKAGKGIARNNAPLGRVVSLGNLQPVRVRVRHINYISNSYTTGTTGSFITQAMKFEINRLRDPESAGANQVWPENFINMARLYKKYKVLGVKITAYFNGQTNNENDRFISIVYGITAGGAIYTPTTDTQVNAVLQEKGIRRWKMYDASHHTKGHNVHHAGWFTPGRVYGDKQFATNEHLYEGSVTAAGAVVSDPERLCTVQHALLAPAGGGFIGGAETYYIRYKLEFIAEWYSRRMSLEGERTEV